MENNLGCGKDTEFYYFPDSGKVPDFELKKVFWKCGENGNFHESCSPNQSHTGQNPLAHEPSKTTLFNSGIQSPLRRKSHFRSEGTPEEPYRTYATGKSGTQSPVDTTNRNEAGTQSPQTKQRENFSDKNPRGYRSSEKEPLDKTGGNHTLSDKRINLGYCYAYKGPDVKEFIQRLKEDIDKRIKNFHDEKLRMSKEREILKRKKRKSWIEINVVTELYKRAEVLEYNFKEFRKVIDKIFGPKLVKGDST